MNYKAGGFVKLSFKALKAMPFILPIKLHLELPFFNKTYRDFTRREI